VHHVHLDPSIAPLYLLRYSTADLPTRCRHSGQTHHRPRRTLRPTDRNIIAFTTLLYSMQSMITIFSRYIVQCPKGVGRNSYQGHVNDSGEFWGVPHQVSMKTQYSGHLYSSLIAKWTWVDHRDQFSLYKESEKTTLSPVQIHCILPCLQSATLYSAQHL
jgi:hypothetical protein